jgi:hypothetical protein
VGYHEHGEEGFNALAPHLSFLVVIMALIME